MNTRTTKWTILKDCNIDVVEYQKNPDYLFFRNKNIAIIYCIPIHYYLMKPQTPKPSLFCARPQRPHWPFSIIGILIVGYNIFHLALRTRARRRLDSQ
jgi:hypothetical protein